MKIKGIRIENFGKLSDFDMTFTDGVTAILQENEWGKSTLVAFIKAMFYGFSGESKRDLMENERKRYKPWQSGTFGGSLVFEAHGKEYQVLRTFGTKAIDDTFALYDNQTHLPSDDYSSNLGEELFQMDRESFQRTVLFSQNDLDTVATDGINAKLGNLSGATDDIDNYETVAKKFKDKLNSLSATRQTGEIAKLRAAITELEGNLRTLPGTEAAFDSKTKEAERLQNQLAAKKALGTKLNAEQQDASTYETTRTKRGQYVGICQAYVERENAVKLAASAFPADIPLAEELVAKSRDTAEIGQLRVEAAAHRLSAEETAALAKDSLLFAAGVPAEENITHFVEIADEMDAKEQQLRSLRFSAEEQADYDAYNMKFAGKSSVDTVADGLMAKVNDASVRRGALASKRVVAENAKPQPVKNSSTTWLALLIAGVFLAAVGVILLSVLGKGPGIAVVCLGAVAAIAGGLMKVLTKPVVVDTSAYDALVAEITSDEKFIADTDRDVQSFLAGFGVASSGSPLSDLGEIRNAYKRYQSLKAKAEDPRAGALAQEITTGKRSLAEFLAPYSSLFVNERDDRTKLQTLGFTRRQYLAWQQKQEEGAAFDRKIAAIQAPLEDYLRGLGFAPGNNCFDLADNYGTANNGFGLVIGDSASADSVLGTADAGFSINGSTTAYNTVSSMITASFSPNTDFTAILNRIAGLLHDYQLAADELARAKAVKEDFEGSNDMTAIRAFVEKDTMRSVAEINTDLENLDIEKNQIIECLQECESQRSLLRDQLDELKDKSDELQEKKEEKARLEKREYLISKARDLLETAKSSFTSKYSAPVANGFKKYYELVEGATDGEQTTDTKASSSTKYSFDANMNLKILDAGEYKDLRFYSAGNRDKVNLCFRMGLVEAMYKGEKPFIIMDDPFTNLDEKRLAGGKKVLRQMAEDYQVIYLTCHQSRVPEGGFDL